MNETQMTLDNPITASLNGNKLRPHQQENLERMLRFQNCFLADEMGLGKTIQAIAFAHHSDAKNILIICPASLRLNWQRELSIWYPLYKNSLTKCIFSAKDKIDPVHKVVIVSYDLTPKPNIHSQICKRHWDLIIYDEASFYFMKQNTKRTKACLEDFWPTALKNLALCGTPVPGSIPGAFPLFNKLAPDLFPEYYRFCNKYSNKTEFYVGKGRFRKKVTNYKGGRNLAELKRHITNRFLVRKTKAEVLKELPDKIFQTIPVQAVRSIRNPLSNEEMSNIVIRLDNNQPITIDDKIAKTRRTIGEAKVKASVDHIKEVMNEKKKLVVFAHHKSVISDLAEQLSDHFSLGVISGKTPPRERQRVVEDFQDGDLQIFLGNIQAAGTGITLTAADTCVFVELDWSPALMAQAIDRLHRIGQKNSVLVQYLVQADTIDGHVLKVLKKKIETINQVVD